MASGPVAADCGSEFYLYIWSLALIPCIFGLSRAVVAEVIFMVRVYRILQGMLCLMAWPDLDDNRILHSFRGQFASALCLPRLSRVSLQ